MCVCVRTCLHTHKLESSPISCRGTGAYLVVWSRRCDVNALGDPVPGEDGKHCECLVARGRRLSKSKAAG